MMTRYCLVVGATGGTLGIIAGFFILLGLHSRLEAIESAGRIIAAIMGLVGGGGVLAACAAVKQKAADRGVREQVMVDEAAEKR